MDKCSLVKDMPNPVEIFAEAKLKQEKLVQQLAASPISEVIGVVSAIGTTGGKVGGEELWTLKTTLDAWRIQGAAIQTRPLTIRRKVTDAELKTFQGLMKEYAIVRIHARVINESPFGGPEGLLEYFLRLDDSDAELNLFATKLQEPVSFDDPTFGTITLNRRINRYTGEATWKGSSIKLCLSAREAADVQAALGTAQSLWQAQDLWDQRVKDYAVLRLLPLKNDNWLGDDEDEVLPEQFKERMKLQSITVQPDGRFEFWHEDGDLFWGHAIHISGSLAKGLTGADTPG
jgi:hypothetical protein